MRNEGQKFICYTVEQIFSSGNPMVRGFLERDYTRELHSQAFYEINIVLRGQATHFIGAQAFTVSEGDTFIVPPNILHGYEGGRGFDVYHVLLSPSFLEKYAASLQMLSAFPKIFKIDPMMRARTSARLFFRLDASALSALSPRLETLAVRSRGKSCADALICEGEALSLTAMLCECYERSGADMTDRAEDAAFLSSLAHLYGHYNERLTVDLLARIARMSRNAYISKFKRVMGEPPARFLRAYRVEMIRQMLVETSMSEAEIAHATGCTDTSHLIRLFFAETGTSPSRYRREVAARRGRTSENEK